MIILLGGLVTLHGLYNAFALTDIPFKVGVRLAGFDPATFCGCSDCMNFYGWGNPRFHAVWPFYFGQVERWQCVSIAAIGAGSLVLGLMPVWARRL